MKLISNLFASLVDFRAYWLPTTLALIWMAFLLVIRKKIIPFSVKPTSKAPVPVSVNYFYTRKCNYSCGFCFHTSKTSFMLDLETAKKGLKLLKDAGMKKLNFAGGEPFLYKDFLGELMKFCKEELALESVSVITNGSKVDDGFLAKYSQYLDILAVSCDSFDRETNIRIGRGTGNHLKHVERVATLCRKYGIRFKLNTVVNSYNWKEDMNEKVKELNPFRWKVFQCLLLADENSGEDTIRDARTFLISDEQFKYFTDTHSQNSCLVAESNDVMTNSYLLLDEYMRFLDKDAKITSASILNVGVEAALKEVRFDEESFHSRNGIYDWSRNLGTTECGSNDALAGLDW